MSTDYGPSPAERARTALACAAVPTVDLAGRVAEDVGVHAVTAEGTPVMLVSATGGARRSGRLRPRRRHAARDPGACRCPFRTGCWRASRSTAPSGGRRPAWRACTCSDGRLTRPGRAAARPAPGPPRRRAGRPHAYRLAVPDPIAPAATRWSPTSSSGTPTGWSRSRICSTDASSTRVDDRARLRRPLRPHLPPRRTCGRRLPTASSSTSLALCTAASCCRRLRALHRRAAIPEAATSAGEPTAASAAGAAASRTRARAGASTRRPRPRRRARPPAGRAVAAARPSSPPASAATASTWLFSTSGTCRAAGRALTPPPTPTASRAGRRAALHPVVVRLRRAHHRDRASPAASSDPSSERGSSEPRRTSASLRRRRRTPPR